MSERALFTAINVTRGCEVGGRIVVASTPIRRAVGLLGRPGLDAGEGLWIRPSRAIHTFGMRFAIDVLFLDRHGRVVRAMERLAPWRLTRPLAGARGVLELAAGTIAGTGTAVGDQIIFWTP